MTNFSVSIYPDPSPNEAAGGPRRGPGVDLVVDLSADHPTITGVTVHPGEMGELPPASLAEVDIREAVALALRLAAPHDLVDAHSARTARDAVTPPPPRADGRQGARRVARNRQRGRNVAANGVPTDVAKTYWKLGSIAKLAEHYDVPHKIARDWIRVLREGGKVPNPWQQRRRN